MSPSASPPRPGADRPNLGVRIGQWLRWCLKKTVWTPLTTLCQWHGTPLQTVQVLVVDRERDLVLGLASVEGDAGFTPVQGLRRSGVHWRGLALVYSGDPAVDACRELGEEAVPPEAASALARRFRLVHRYAEGVNRQFDCRVYLAEADSRHLPLRAENTEGKPVWLDRRQAMAVFNDVLAGILAALPPAAEAVEGFTGNRDAADRQP